MLLCSSCKLNHRVKPATSSIMSRNYALWHAQTWWSMFRAFIACLQLLLPKFSWCVHSHALCLARLLSCYTCRAFAKLAYVPCEPFLAAAALQLLTDLPRCVPQDISNATWAFATLRHHPGNTLMDACAQTAARTMPHFKPQEIANTLW